jgi:16S rRNA G966 N2-methylase RsmD
MILSRGRANIYLGDCLKWLGQQKRGQWDLIHIDPPFGVNYDGSKPKGINKRAVKEDVAIYADEWRPEWNIQWMNEALRVGKRVVMGMHWMRFNWWVKTFYDRIVGYLFLVFKNGQGQTRVCNHNAVHPFICLSAPTGEELAAKENVWDREHRAHWNFFESELTTQEEWRATWMEGYIPNGFLRESWAEDKKEMDIKINGKVYKASKLAEGRDSHHFRHTSPKPFLDYYNMIKELNPTSIADLFTGSGAVPEVAAALDIPCGGSELNLDKDGNPAGYEEDIIYRIDRGIKFREALLAQKATSVQRTLI